MAARFLTLCRSVDRQLWAFQHPLRQFEKHLGHEVLKKLEGRKMDIHRLKDMSADEIGTKENLCLHTHLIACLPVSCHREHDQSSSNGNSS